MPVSQGSAGGLPGLNLKAWAQVTVAAVLVRGLNASGVSTSATGVYKVTLAAAVSVNAVVLVRLADWGFAKGYVTDAGASITVAIAGAADGVGAKNAPFYVEVYD